MKRETFNKARGIDDEINHNKLMLRKAEKLKGYYADMENDTPQPKAVIKIAGEEIEVPAIIVTYAFEVITAGLTTEISQLEKEFEEL